VPKRTYLGRHEHAGRPPTDAASRGLGFRAA
jgi:hypothetical protein